MMVVKMAGEKVGERAGMKVALMDEKTAELKAGMRVELTENK